MIRVGAVAGIICNRITCGCGYPLLISSEQNMNVHLQSSHIYNKAYLHLHNKESFKTLYKMDV